MVCCWCVRRSSHSSRSRPRRRRLRALVAKQNQPPVDGTGQESGGRLFVFGFRLRKRALNDRLLARKALLDIQRPLVAQTVDAPALRVPGRATAGKNQRQQRHEGYRFPTAAAKLTGLLEQICASAWKRSQFGRICWHIWSAVSRSFRHRDRGRLSWRTFLAWLTTGWCKVSSYLRWRQSLACIDRATGSRSSAHCLASDSTTNLLSAPALALRTACAVFTTTTRATVAHSTPLPATADSCNACPHQAGLPHPACNAHNGPVMAQVRVERGSTREMSHATDSGCTLSLQSPAQAMADFSWQSARCRAVAVTCAAKNCCTHDESQQTHVVRCGPDSR